MPDASFADMRAIGKPVAFDARAEDLDVRGLGGWRLESVRVLDDRHDLVADKALAASFANGRLRLAKSEPGSAVFLVRFCDERTGR